MMRFYCPCHRKLPGQCDAPTWPRSHLGPSVNLKARAMLVRTLNVFCKVADSVRAMVVNPNWLSRQTENGGVLHSVGTRVWRQSAFDSRVAIARAAETNSGPVVAALAYICSVFRGGTALVVAGTLALSGCASVGPQSVTAGRGVYTEVINRTENEQILNVLVRMRYDETFGMISVASITANLRFSARAGAHVR